MLVGPSPRTASCAAPRVVAKFKQRTRLSTVTETLVAIFHNANLMGTTLPNNRRRANIRSAGVWTFKESRFQGRPSIVTRLPPARTRIIFISHLPARWWIMHQRNISLCGFCCICLPPSCSGPLLRPDFIWLYLTRSEATPPSASEISSAASAADTTADCWP